MREREQQKQDEAKKKMERQTDQPEMRNGFGRYTGRTCESMYKEDRNYCGWVISQSFKNSLRQLKESDRRNQERKREEIWKRGRGNWRKTERQQKQR